MNNYGIWLKREYLQGGIKDVQFACSNCDYTSGFVMTDWHFCPVCGSRNFITYEEYRNAIEKGEEE